MATYRQQPSFDGSTHELGGSYQQAPYGGGGAGYEKTYPEPSRIRGGDGGTGDYGYAPPQKKKKNKWLWVGLPLLLLAIILGAVLGGVLGSRAAKDNDSSSSSSTGGSAAAGGGPSNTRVSTATDPGTAAASSAAAKGLARVAVGTDTYLLPVYPTSTNSALYAAPTESSRANHTWPADNEAPSTSSIRAHPRLIAPKFKWDALNSLIANDPYLASWNATIFANASTNFDAAPQPYTEDGGLSGSGILDPAREIKLRIKNWAYAYKMSGDTRWADRAWTELNTAMGNNPDVPFGVSPTRWNAAHFLDLAEMTSAFGIAYDWFYDAFDDDKKSTIRQAIIEYGLNYCDAALTGASSAGAYSWWTAVNGNWNCVCNAGCTLGALAIVDEDTTGIAQRVIDNSVNNAKGNCATAVYDDGTWTETPNYWYFGTTGFAEHSAALTSAYGSDSGLATANPDFHLTGLYHIYVTGMTSLFNYADHGPNKYSANANSMMYMGSAYDEPRYTLFQRDRIDASEPFGIFYYDPSVTGAWWNGLPLDRHFPNSASDWASIRSSWTDNDGLYLAAKAGNMTGHQTHGDLDAGDFVIDALGQRWAGELGSGNYLSTEYFASEAQDADRWLYYRKRTEGQNTIVINRANQLVDVEPSTQFGTSNDTQGDSTVMTLNSQSTAFYTMDMTGAYGSPATSVRRGFRTLNQRKQILVQDEIAAPTADNIQWRMHTNATISISSDGLTATLTLAEKTCEVSLVNTGAAAGARFTTAEPVRYSTDPALPQQPTFDGEQEVGDQENLGTTVLVIDLPGGTYSLQVLFNPQWDDGTTFVTPPSVAIADWTLESHN